MRELKVDSTVLEMLPEWLGELCGLETLNLGSCNALMALPASLGALTGLTTLNLRHCEELTALPVELRALTGLTTRSIILRRAGCAACRARGAHGTGDAEPGKLQRADGSAGRFRGAHDPGEPVCFKVCGLHTPPPIVVRAGTMAVTQYLRDLAKGYVSCHFAKVVLLGNLCAGKSSLADSLVLGRPATRAADDWAVPSRVLPTTAPLVSTCAAGGSVAAKGSARKKLVVNICDITGQRVYRASHLPRTCLALASHLPRTCLALASHLPRTCS